MTKILVDREVLEQVLDALNRVDAVERGMVTTKAHHYAAREETTEAIAKLRALLDAQSEPAICGVCGYSGTSTDKNGQCPRCHWDELVTPSGGKLRSALNAMLTQFGMDEDEWNKPTFDQARAALDAPSETTTAQLVRSDIEIHLAHCFQAPYETSCKYDDADCPATPKETQ